MEVLRLWELLETRSVFKVAVGNAKRFPRSCGRPRLRRRVVRIDVTEVFHRTGSRVSFHSLSCLSSVNYSSLLSDN